MHKRMDIPTAHIHRESEKHKLGWRIGFHLSGMRFHGNNPLNNEPVLFSVPKAGAERRDKAAARKHDEEEIRHLLIKVQINKEINTTFTF